MAATAPQPRLTGDAPAEFLETRMNIPEGIVFSKEMDRFLPKEDEEVQKQKVEALWNATIEDRDKLFHAMEVYQGKIAKKEPSICRLNIRTCNWPDVMKEFERAMETYKVERRKGASGAIIACLRKVGENADDFAMWINLLPNGDYGAGICGAFKLILGAIGRMDNVRNTVYQALQDIPEAVSQARRYRKIYSDVKVYELSQKTAALFSSVLNALEKIITVLTEPGWKRASKALFKGDAYSDPIIESINKVKVNAIAIEKEAQICAQARSRKMDDEQQRINHMVEFMFFNKLIPNLYHNMLLSNPDIDRNTRQPYPAVNQEIKAKPCQRQKRVMENKSQSEPLTTPRLLAILKHDTLVPAADINSCRLEAGQMSLSSKDRVSYIARSDHLRHWLLTTQESSSLLIMGNTSEPAAFVSPLSFLAAELASLYASTGSTATLSYFCGLHIDFWKDPLANSIGVITSLLGQLLEDEHFDFDIGFIDHELSERLQNHDVEACCEIFKILVLQIKEMIMLLCFVDTISLYEPRESQEETKTVLGTLRWLVEETGRRRLQMEQGVVFKLMVTEPGIRCAAMELFEEEEVFVVEGYIDGGRQGVIVLEGLEPVPTSTN